MPQVNEGALSYLSLLLVMLSAEDQRMKTCQSCLRGQEYICLTCGGCEACCGCELVVQQERWVHVSSKEGSMKRNHQLMERTRGGSRSGT